MSQKDTKAPALPQSGGSFIRQDDGGLTPASQVPPAPKRTDKKETR